MIDEVVKENIGLVRSCVSKFFFKNLDYDDVFQAGCIGLTRAAQKFDASKGTKFSTYAVPFIFGEIKNFFHSNRKFKIGRDSDKLYSLIKSEQNSFFENNGRDPSLSEISEILNVSIEDILESIESHKDISSMDEDDSNLKSQIFEESHEKSVSEKIDIRNAIENLSDKDKKLINLRFFEFKTQSDSAKILGMSQVQISRREKKILKILRSKL